MPATAVGSKCGVEVMGVLGPVPGVEVPTSPVMVRVRGAAFSMVEMYEAREPFSFVTERSQSDLPVEMTTWGKVVRCYQINTQSRFCHTNLSAVRLHRSQHIRSRVYHRRNFFRVLLMSCGNPIRRVLGWIKEGLLLAIFTGVRAVPTVGE